MFTRLLCLQYCVIYKPGHENCVANALSRRSHTDELNSISASYASDPKAQELLIRLSVSESSDSGFSLHNGLIRHNGKLWVDADISL